VSVVLVVVVVVYPLVAGIRVLFQCFITEGLATPGIRHGTCIEVKVSAIYISISNSTAVLFLRSLVFICTSLYVSISFCYSCQLIEQIECKNTMRMSLQANWFYKWSSTL